jgi:hypothetical protein
MRTHDPRPRSRHRHALRPDAVDVEDQTLEAEAGDVYRHPHGDGAASASTHPRYRSRNREGVSMTLKIVGLGGSLAGNSKSRAALQTALGGAASVGATTQLLDIRQLGLPMYNPDDHEPTETAATLIESCHAADGLLWSSPLYQGTISGALKNALDWLRVLGDRDPPYLHDKVIGLISAAGGRRGCKQSTRWSSRSGRSEDGRCPTSFRSRRPPESSTARAGFRIKPSSCSSRRSGARSYASPSGSPPTIPFIGRTSVRGRLNALRQPHSRSPG